jgi:hypothetical protein
VKIFTTIVFNFVFIVYGILVVRKLSDRIFYFSLVLIDLVLNMANLVLVFTINKFAKTIFRQVLTATILQTIIASIQFVCLILNKYYP